MFSARLKPTLLGLELIDHIIIAKNNLPLVKLVPHNPKAKRKLGLLRGQIKIPDDFMEENDGINHMFYGD